MDAVSLSNTATMDAKVSKAFKFSGDQMEESLQSIDSILCGGRSIPFEKPRNFRTAAYADQSPLLLKSNRDDDSFKRQLSLHLPRDSKVGSRSNSPGQFKTSLATGYGSSSPSPRKYKSIIGVTKFNSKMDMNDIKRRQSHQLVPTPLVPEAFDGGESIVIGRGGRGGHWGLLRPLRFTANLVNALSRASLGCIPHV